MDALTLAVLGTLVVKVVSVVKSIGKDNNAVVTQLVGWAVGIGVAFLAAHAQVTSDLVVFGAHRFGDLDGGSLVFAGLSLASGGSFAYDVKKALDYSDSASEPRLLKAPTG